MTGFNPPPGEPWNNPGEPTPPIQPTSNPFANLEPMDLSQAIFEKKAEIDPQKVEDTLREVEALVQSNLEQAAKWQNILRTVEATLRSAGYVVRIAGLV